MTALGITDIDDATRSAAVRIVSQVLADSRGAALRALLRRRHRPRGHRGEDEPRDTYLTRRARFVAEREGVMFVVRSLFGLASIWATLGAEGDRRALARGFMGASGVGVEVS